MKIVDIHFHTLPSTNNWAKEHLEEYALDELVVITADEQTKGRGRFERTWHSPSHQNLYVTFVFFVKEEDPLMITQTMARCLVSLLAKHSLHATIKQPNDIFINGKKIAGILTETRPHGNHFGVVIGVGLNVNMPDEVLQGVGQPATSLFAETGKMYEIGKILEELKRFFSEKLKEKTGYMDPFV